MSEAKKVFYADLKASKVCATCIHAKMRRDICQIYCLVGQVSEGICDRYEEYRRGRKKQK